MTWRFLGRFVLTKNWQYTTSTNYKIFRIKNNFISNKDNQYLKGAISSVFIENQRINLFDSRRLSWRSEPEIFVFDFPRALGNQRLGLRRLDNTKLIWTVDIETFEPETLNLELTFGEATIMDYLISKSQGLQSVIPKTVSFSAKFANVTLMVAANESRLHLIVRASTKKISLYTEIAADGSGKNLIEEIPAGQLFILPNTGGLYKGEVFAQSAVADSTISYTEYS